MTLIVGTDGACKPNPGPSGWAWVVDRDCWQSGALGEQTNNIAELHAILAALGAIPRQQDVRILTDSQYAVKALNTWGPGWRRNGWMTRDGKPVQNREYLQLIGDVIRDRSGSTLVEWVRGHAGHPLNEAADRLAVRAREQSPAAALVWGPGWVSPRLAVKG